MRPCSTQVNGVTGRESAVLGVKGLVADGVRQRDDHVFCHLEGIRLLGRGVCPSLGVVKAEVARRVSRRITQSTHCPIRGVINRLSQGGIAEINDGVLQSVPAG